MSLVQKIRRHGLIGSARRAAFLAASKSGWHQWRYRDVAQYESPNADDLNEIESDLESIGVNVEDYSPSPQDFRAFRDEHLFPDDYHGGRDSGVWHEKLLEHWIAATRLDLMNFARGDIYVDFAAASSPWAKVLRERLDLEGYAIDIGAIPEEYKHLPYYRRENATATEFADASVRGASLQCAYEMFTGQDDVNFIVELGRILATGGKAIVSPLYMHTHYCAYSTPEFFGKGYSDPNAIEYVKLNHAGVPSSRKYDAHALKKRVLDTIEREGMRYRIFALRNKDELGPGIYCHFILEISR